MVHVCVGIGMCYLEKIFLRSLRVSDNASVFRTNLTVTQSKEEKASAKDLC